MFLLPAGFCRCFLPSDALGGLSDGVEGQELAVLDMELGVQVLQPLPGTITQSEVTGQTLSQGVS